MKILTKSEKNSSSSGLSTTYRFTMIHALVMMAMALTITAAEKKISPGNELNAQKRTAIVEKVVRTLNEHYIFPEKARDMEKQLKKNLKNREYDGFHDLKSFTRRLTGDLQSVSKDLHLRVVPYKHQQEKKIRIDPGVLRQKQLAIWQKNNFGFQEVKRLDGNIGYIKLTGFYNARNGGRTAIAALNFLAFCNALIIDLRENSGGQPSMSQLICSYFFDKPQHLNSIYHRKGDIIEQLWTRAHVEGPRLTDTPVFVLVSKATVSAAEGFAYALKYLKRATIIGEKTRGGAHPQKPFDLPEASVTVHIPDRRAINPITRTNWEGKGVIPDIRVAAVHALESARIEALKKLLKKEADEKVRHGLSMIMEEVEAMLKPTVLDEDTLLQYIGSYDRGGKVTLKNGSLQVMGFYILIPMGNDKFMIKNGKEQVQFKRDDSGNLSGFTVIFRSGQKVSFKRLK